MIVTLILIAFVLGTAASRGALLYYHWLARKRGEDYFPKYAKRAYAIVACLAALMLLGCYLLKTYW